LGYSEFGVSEKINILGENTEADIKYCLKTASGFGGCNAALIIEKN
jgi:3-oxoacyl-(acyl-carrier-protein) synthase